LSSNSGNIWNKTNRTELQASHEIQIWIKFREI
jgi:hypothetical protein